MINNNKNQKEKEINFSKKEIKPFSVPTDFPSEITLKKWYPNDKEHILPEGFFAIFFGSRRIGKSVALKGILFRYKTMFDLVIVMTQTPQNGYWQPVVGNQWVHSGFNPDLLERLVMSQNQLMEKALHEGGKKEDVRKVLLILDDVISERYYIHQSSALTKLATQGRHSNISVCITTQYPKAIGTEIRENADICFIFQQKTERCQEAVYYDFLTLLGPKPYGMYLLKKYTSEHNCIVVERHKLSQNPEDIIFWMEESVMWNKEKQKPTYPEYVMGCREQKILAKTPEGKLPIFSSY